MSRCTKTNQQPTGVRRDMKGVNAREGKNVQSKKKPEIRQKTVNDPSFLLGKSNPGPKPRAVSEGSGDSSSACCVVAVLALRCLLLLPFPLAKRNDQRKERSAALALWSLIGFGGKELWLGGPVALGFGGH